MSSYQAAPRGAFAASLQPCSDQEARLFERRFYQSGAALLRIATCQHISQQLVDVMRSLLAFQQRHYAAHAKMQDVSSTFSLRPAAAAHCQVWLHA